MLVEPHHELCGGAVRDLPERSHNRPCASVLECAGEADEALSSHFLSESCLAGRENDKVGVDTYPFEDLPGLEEAVLRASFESIGWSEDDGGVQREVGIKHGVRGEMDVVNVAAYRHGSLLGCHATQVNMCMLWEQIAQRNHFHATAR